MILPGFQGFPGKPAVPGVRSEDSAAGLAITLTFTPGVSSSDPTPAAANETSDQPPWSERRLAEKGELDRRPLQLGAR